MKSLDMAAQYLGAQETEGPNNGPVLAAIRDAMLYPGAPPCSWCALFVSWVLCRCYAPADLSKKAYRGWLRNALGFDNDWIPESCQAWWEGSMRQRLIMDHPQPGDLFILLNSERHAHHMGIVEHGLPENEFQSIEGNTNAGGSVNGDGVYRRTRTASERTVFVRLPEPLRA